MSDDHTDLVEENDVESYFIEELEFSLSLHQTSLKKLMFAHYTEAELQQKCPICNLPRANHLGGFLAGYITVDGVLLPCQEVTLEE